MHVETKPSSKRRRAERTRSGNIGPKDFVRLSFGQDGTRREFATESSPVPLRVSGIVGIRSVV